MNPDPRALAVAQNIALAAAQQRDRDWQAYLQQLAAAQQAEAAAQAQVQTAQAKKSYDEHAAAAQAEYRSKRWDNRTPAEMAHELKLTYGVPETSAMSLAVSPELRTAAADALLMAFHRRAALEEAPARQEAAREAAEEEARKAWNWRPNWKRPGHSPSLEREVEEVTGRLDADYGPDRQADEPATDDVILDAVRAVASESHEGRAALKRIGK
jgi:hypothetical protein